MRVRVLGDLEVVVGESPDDRPVDLGGPKPRTLLALLIAAGGRPVTVEQLIDQMWGEDPPARVEASLQSHVARLRRALEPDREVRSPSGPAAHARRRLLPRPRRRRGRRAPLRLARPRGTHHAPTTRSR